MKRNFDFHVHSNVSDGSFAPGDLVRAAAGEGIEFLAITDHDTVSGVAEAVEAGKEAGVVVIPGLEISIEFGPGTFHLCGYGIDIENGKLRSALDFVQEERKNRNDLIIARLNGIGVMVTMAEVRAVAGADQVGRPHFAKVIIAGGYAETFQGIC